MGSFPLIKRRAYDGMASFRETLFAIMKSDVAASFRSLSRFYGILRFPLVAYFRFRNNMSETAWFTLLFVTCRVSFFIVGKNV